jgi:DNA-binding transcriptional regulator YdaS (Cro superfamily)
MDGMDLIRAERGLISKVARELHISRSAIAMWDKVPAERVVDVEKASGIPRHKLRPDLHLEPDDKPAFANRETSETEAI